MIIFNVAESRIAKVLQDHLISRLEKKLDQLSSESSSFIVIFPTDSDLCVE